MKSLEKPTQRLIKEYNLKFKENKRYFIADQAIIKLFEKFDKNIDIKDILLKISVINDLYSTNIFATFKMAEHILVLNIDDTLKMGDPKAVNKIAKIIINGKQKNFYSFATKYCNWHNQLKYPIYDSYVDKILRVYRKETKFYKFANNDLKDYTKFLIILTRFRDFFNLKSFNFKEIDKFLWTYGKELYGSNKY